MLTGGVVVGVHLIYCLEVFLLPLFACVFLHSLIYYSGGSFGSQGIQELCSEIPSELALWCCDMLSSWHSAMFQDQRVSTLLAAGHFCTDSEEPPLSFKI